MNSYRMEPLAEDDWQRIAALRLESLRESPQWLAGDLHDEQTRGESEWRKEARESFWSAITCNGVDVAIKCMFRCSEIYEAFDPRNRIQVKPRTPEIRVAR